MSVFTSSTQGKRWLHESLDVLHQVRVAYHSDPSSSSLRPTPNESREELSARLLDEDQIIRHFCGYILKCVGPRDPSRGKIMFIVSLFSLSSLFPSLQSTTEEDVHILRSWKVPATACIYLWRFYLNNSILDYDPRVIMPACLFLASKVEENYINVNEICDVLQGNVEDVIKVEMKVLEQLNFDVRVFHPESCLNSIIADYHIFIKSKDSDDCGHKDHLVSSSKDLLAEAPTCLYEGSTALHKRIQRAKKNLQLLRTTPCSLIATPALIAMIVIMQDTTEDGEQFTEFSKYVVNRLGEDVLKAIETKKHDVVTLLQAVSTDIDGDKVKKIMKRLFKASAWKKKDKS